MVVLDLHSYPHIWTDISNIYKDKYMNAHLQQNNNTNLSVNLNGVDYWELCV